MTRTPVLVQDRVEQAALKAARWEGRAWAHYLESLALTDTPPSDAAALAAALDDCEYCCRRLQAMAMPYLRDARIPYEPPLTPGERPLPAGYVYNPLEVPEVHPRFHARLRQPRQLYGARSRRAAGSYAVLTGLTAMASLGVWRIVIAALRG